jgi:nitroreductase
MELNEAIETRRSVRKYTDQGISDEDLREIVRLASYSPSWKNTQCVSWLVVENKDLKSRIAEEGVCGYEFNCKTIKRCHALAVLVTEKGKSGCEADGSFSTSKKDTWEMFDAGIAAQTFCLAAKGLGIGTVILGILDDAKIAEILGLPENKTVASCIAMGYPIKQGNMPPRKSVDELLEIRK